MEVLHNDEPQMEAATPVEKTNWKAVVLDFVETITLALLLFIGINTVSARVRVEGFSMQPTLQDGEFVLVNRVAYRFGQPERGDIIVFRDPNNPHGKDLIKRIIGLPGDTIVIHDGTVSLNGQLLHEDYIAAPPVYSGQWEVPAGHLFVLGDNRNDSSDSHSWGLLPIENVIGKAVLIYWPPPEWNILKHPEVLASTP
ncbi:MAG: signal peptidase I [Anaerolineae bacterium]